MSRRPNRYHEAYRGLVLNSIVGILGVIVGSIISDSRKDPTIDLRQYLDFLCEKTALTRNIASIDLDLKAGSKIKIGTHEVESLGNGLISLKREGSGAITTV